MPCKSDTELTGRQFLHDLLAASTYHGDFYFPKNALTGRAAHKTHTARNLHSLISAILHGLGSVILKHADFGDPIGIRLIIVGTL